MCRPAALDVTRPQRLIRRRSRAAQWLRKHLKAEGSDLLREMVVTFARQLMAAEVDVLCNAGYGEVTSERVNRGIG
jgi:hypothetical protein